MIVGKYTVDVLEFVEHTILIPLAMYLTQTASMRPILDFYSNFNRNSDYPFE